MTEAAKVVSQLGTEAPAYGATLPPAVRKTDDLVAGPSGSSATDTDSEFGSPATIEKRGMLMTLLSKSHVRSLLASGFMSNLLGVGAEVVFVLYSYTSIELGGMARSVRYGLKDTRQNF